MVGTRSLQYASFQEYLCNIYYYDTFLVKPLVRNTRIKNL